MSVQNQPPIRTSFLFVLLSSLYFSQGFPSGLLAHAMPAIMRDYGSSLTAIGMLKLLALPWLFKFLWAPLVDRFYYSPLGPHRSWILVMQMGAVFTLFGLSVLSPDWLFTQGIWVLFVLLVLLNVFSSTQDVATDGLAVTLLSKKLRGLGNSIQVCGYKVGLMLGGAGLLVLVDHWGWDVTVQSVAIILLIMLLPTLLFKENSVLQCVRAMRADTSLPNQTVDRSNRGYNFWSFFSVPSIVSWLLVLLSYKLADGVSSTLVKPMLIDMGMTKSEVGYITLVSSIAGLVGALVIGFIYARLRPVSLLLFFAVLQMCSISAYSIVPSLDISLELDLYWLYAIILQDQMVDTMSTVVLFAVMMSHCRVGHEGGDYTLQACLQVFSAGIAGALGGLMADALGNYVDSFLIAGLLSLLPLLALFFYRRSPITHDHDPTVNKNFS